MRRKYRRKKIPKSVRFRDFFIGFFSNRFQKKLRPDFQHGGGLERIHDGFKGSVCDISSQILTFLSSHGKMYILSGGT